MWFLLSILVPIIFWGEFFKDLKGVVYGKKFAILGQRGVGKTHLWKFLSTGSIPDKDIEQTVGAEVTPASYVKIKELGLDLLPSIDVGGSTDDYTFWKEAHDKADYVLYLFRVDLLLKDDNDHVERMDKDVRQLSYFQKDKQKRLFLVGTHCDNDETYKTAKIGDYHDRIRSTKIVKALAKESIVNTKDVLVGSMRSKESTESLLYRIFSEVRRHD